MWCPQEGSCVQQTQVQTTVFQSELCTADSGTGYCLSEGAVYSRLRYRLLYIRGSCVQQTQVQTTVYQRELCTADSGTGYCLSEIAVHGRLR